MRPSAKSGFLALRRIRVPSVAGFGLDVGEPGARRGIGDADEVVAGRTLNLAAGMTRVALQRLVTVGTVEFKFIGAHKLRLDHGPTGRKNTPKIYSYF